MSNLGTISKVIREACILARLHPHLLGIPGISASSSRHRGLQETAFDGDRTVGSLGQCVRGSR